MSERKLHNIFILSFILHCTIGTGLQCFEVPDARLIFLNCFVLNDTIVHALCSFDNRPGFTCKCAQTHSVMYLITVIY